MQLTEAEIQVLATVCKSGLDDRPLSRAALESQGDRFWIFREDWSGAFSSLMEKGLLEGDANAYRLTDASLAPASAYHQQRPDHYWYYYQRFYTAAYASAAHSRLCERVYGKDLCQDGQMDMACLGEMLDRMDLGPDDSILDLGCGAGAISEYISDTTGALVTGIDYADAAIAAAMERTEDKRARLQFIHGDLSALELPAQTYDAAIMIDSIYWVADTVEALSSVIKSLKSNGQLAIVIEQKRAGGDGPEVLDKNNTPTARSLKKLNLDYETIDKTEQFKAFWPRVKAAVVDLRGEFEAEGNGFIRAALEREADDSFLPAIRADAIRRYIYYVKL